MQWQYIFTERLKQRREELKWTQATLAKKLGTQPGAISHFENGRRLPCVENLRDLARFLGVAADWLLGLQ